MSELLCRVIERGPSCGVYRDAPIPEWIRTGDGTLWRYNGVFSDPHSMDNLGDDECLIAPGLRFRSATE